MIPFHDLTVVHAELADEIEAATERVLRSGRYILGAEVEAFEDEFARYHGMRHAIGVASGTDALHLALKAAGIGPGDEVVTVAWTAVATVNAIEQTGAKPVFVDVCPQTCTIDVAAAASAITPRTKAIVPVHLYGQPADLTRLRDLADRYHLFLLEDCAQAAGARWEGRRVGTWGNAAAFSFYPTKNLGACGDGGAVLTNDDRLAARLRRLRHHGQGNRYHHLERGFNSRLDELQAAILRVKLPHLDAHNRQRQRLAGCYRRHLRGVELPPSPPATPGEHVYHLYVIRHPQRQLIHQRLAQRRIETLIHYPVPVHRQPAFADLGYAEGSLPITERLAREVLSLPLYPGLKPSVVARVARAISLCVEAPVPC
ncbi:MAG: DegT/DnrJ/EryC1/StrS family aminotransferase [Gemmataceae bacterium]|nr:DegT/DnrJ/EryC1/StrS family aminotransferase [Gemmataceae bacterium]MDW8263754.1 DegT/DnrJ/EryC1/StrS family aminotransferase [Gemmataceae bacterium]